MSLIDTGTVYPYVSEQVGYEPGTGYYLIATGQALSLEDAAALAGGAMYESPYDGVATIYPGGRGGVVDYPVTPIDALIPPLGGYIGNDDGIVPIRTVNVDPPGGIYTMAGNTGGAHGSGLLPFLLIGFALFAARH